MIAHFTDSTIRYHLSRAPKARHARIPIATILCLSTLISGVAEGFRNPAPGAFGLARSGGRRVHVEDATAVTHNPANLTRLQGAEVELSPTFVYIQSDFRPAAGGQATTEDPWKVLPNVFAAAPMDDRASVGLALTTPYGLSNEWENTGAFAFPLGPLRYTAPHFTELQTINVNPSFAYKFSDALSVGVGMDVMWSQLTLRQHFPWFLFPGGVGVDPEGLIDAEGDGVGFGADVGITWNLNDRHAVAVTYRSPVHVEYTGDFNLSNVPARAGAAGITSRSQFRSSIKFPTIVGVGYGWQVTDRLQLEANGEWLQFSNFDSLNLGVGNNAPLFPTGTSFPQNWDDTFTVGLAADYALNANWSVRGSYHYFESPVPDETISPTIPDSDQNAITMGVAYQKDGHSCGLSYSIVFYDDRTISNNQNPVFNGEYETSVHLIAASYSLRF